MRPPCAARSRRRSPPRRRRRPQKHRHPPAQRLTAVSRPCRGTVADAGTRAAARHAPGEFVKRARSRRPAAQRGGPLPSSQSARKNASGSSQEHSTAPRDCRLGGRARSSAAESCSARSDESGSCPIWSTLSRDQLPEARTRGLRATGGRSSGQLAGWRPREAGPLSPREAARQPPRAQQHQLLEGVSAQREGEALPPASRRRLFFAHEVEPTGARARGRGEG